MGAVLGGVGFAGTGLADQFHYNNVPVGTRAVGMGGAFTGIADDASGIYYNPAGIAFALANDIQGSANAFYDKTTTYKDTLGPGSDFTEHSSGSLTPFFGGLQKLDKYAEGLVFAFGVYYTDGDLKDQDDLIEGKNLGSSTIERYHRTSNERAGTYYAGAAVGYRPRPNFAIGFGLNYYNADELVQEYQYAKQSATLKSGDTTVPGFSILTSNVREHLAVYGIQPTLGFQAALPAGLSIGATVKQTFTASQHFDSTSETDETFIEASQNSTLPTEGSGGVVQPAQLSQNISSVNTKKPVGTLPFEARLGVAWFATPTFVMDVDVAYYGAVTDADQNVDPGTGRARYDKEAVTNFAAGGEWYISPSFPLRFGVFTNYDARPEVAKGTPDAADGITCNTNADYAKKYCGEPDHIDYYGGSLFIAWVQPNSQISAGFVYQQGKGKSEKLGDDQVQDVASTQYSFAFSATHNL
jgi:long-chain fatty acid transport protein